MMTSLRTWRTLHSSLFPSLVTMKIAQNPQRLRKPTQQFKTRMTQLLQQLQIRKETRFETYRIKFPKFRLLAKLVDCVVKKKIKLQKIGRRKIFYNKWNKWNKCNDFYKFVYVSLTFRLSLSFEFVVLVFSC